MAQAPVVAFAGSIGSGKSTLSLDVATALGWPYGSFGEYVRTVAAERGRYQSSREDLQEIGAALASEGWKGFCQGVLSRAGWQSGQPLVIDGIRHAEALETLRALVTPSRCYLVYVAISEAEHITRMRAKGINDPRQQERIDMHSTEVQVRTLLPRMADITIDGSRPKVELVAEIVQWVRQHALAAE